MKKYTVSSARERLADVLDEAQRGQPVIIERKGVRYRVSLDTPARRRKAARPSVIDVRDPAVERGHWTWDYSPRGVKFTARRRS